MIFLLLVSVYFSGTPYLPDIGGQYRCAGKIKMASASTPLMNEPAKDLILVHTVQLKRMIKAQISGRMVSNNNTM